MDKRKENFKLGRFHGKKEATKNKSEAAIQRAVYSRQIINIVRSRRDNKNTAVRLIGYEVPLERYRGECIDLLGYDCEMNLWIIELKHGKSEENLEEIRDQVNRYTDHIKESQLLLEKDFKKVFYIPTKFRKVRRLILAPAEFYIEKSRSDFKDKTVEYAYFKDKNVADKRLWAPVNVHIVKKSK